MWKDSTFIMTKEQETSSIPKQLFAFPSPGQTARGAVLLIKADKGAVLVAH